jgi:hypothetical protein
MEAQTIESPVRRLTVLNEAGDTTISWTEDRDEEMEAIIQKKMDQGVTFFIVTRGRGKTLTQRGPKLDRAADARKQRALVIPDEDLAKFVEGGLPTRRSGHRASVEAPRRSPGARTSRRPSRGAEGDVAHTTRR